ncbi:hypothetical protein BASA81_001641 [Batrachochytrium salamandrivorans]|nr:hypothetical protein BASA81_001641 [Batrachochytrium salamandrivorans]
MLAELGLGVLAALWLARARVRGKPVALRNAFYFARHGESEANVANIVSAFQLGRHMHGLTSKGRAEVLEQASQVLLPRIDPLRTTIVASPFLRTRETADVIAQALSSSNEVLVSEALRERNFGEFEGLPAHESYHKCWAEDQDLANTLPSSYQCESVQDVATRTLQLVLELDQLYLDGQHVFVLVSHGDAIQIARSRLLGLNPRLHRFEPHVVPGQIVAI